MIKIKFEYRISLVYLLIGCLWILFSDLLVNTFIHNIEGRSVIQIYKGWFYVFATTFFLCCFLRNHLKAMRATKKELRKHRKNLQNLVHEKTKNLDQVVTELSLRNDTIKAQNEQLRNTIKELKSTQTQLLQAEKMSSLGILTSGISHEINNPLNYILGGVTGLESECYEGFPNKERANIFFDSIKTGVERVTTIISGLNEFSQNDNDYCTSCDIHNILDKDLLMINNLIEPNIKVHKEYSKKPVILLGNSGQLHQLFISTLMNACQSISDIGSITISTKITNKEVNIQIKDTGSGISKENLTRITDPFYTTKPPGQGTGLGLTIAYNIVKAHHGTLRFLSELNKGTSVIIDIPTKTKS